jgi:hypothetical protein
MNKALCLLFPLSVVACFDVETVDPGITVEPFLVDDFESADQLPQPPFQQWACRAFQPNDDQSAVASCAFERPGHNSPTAFTGTFLLEDERNGSSEFEGASLSASTTRPLDLRRYREVVVSVKFFPEDSIIGSASNNLYIELTCRSARVDGLTGEPSGEVPSVIREVQATDSVWFSFRIPLSHFDQPFYQHDKIIGDTEACLARVDSLAFVLGTDVADGAVGGARLFIDNVSFE